MRRLAAAPVFSFGFRPLFLAGAGFAALAVLIWGLWLCGHWFDLQPTGGMLAWHRHEMPFGFAAAIVGGFLLTAVPNWTGIPGVRGGALIALVSVWLLGRGAWVCTGVDRGGLPGVGGAVFQPWPRLVRGALGRGVRAVFTALHRDPALAKALAFYPRRSAIISNDCGTGLCGCCGSRRSVNCRPAMSSAFSQLDKVRKYHGIGDHSP